MPSSTETLSLSQFATARSGTSVAVQVADRYGERPVRRRRSYRGGKRPVAEPQQHRDVVAVVVRHGQVGHLVAVQVADRYGP